VPFDLREGEDITFPLSEGVGFSLPALPPSNAAPGTPFRDRKRLFVFLFSPDKAVRVFSSLPNYSSAVSFFSGGDERSSL